jgi:type IV pilus assembly protein PilA
MQNRNPYAAPRANVAGGDVGDEDYGEIKIFSAQGRIGRVRYIGYSMGLALLAWLVIGILAAIAVGIQVDQTGLILVAALGYVAVLVVQFLFNIQRSHDMNMTGWLSLIWLVPFGVLVFWFVPGTRGENDYGKRPPPNTAGVIILTCLVPFASLGVLAAIAIPAYQDYTIRAQVSEGLSLASGPKAAVMEIFGRTGAAPADRLEAGLSADPTDTAGLYVDSVDVVRGTVVVTYSANANAAIAGSVLAIRPYVMPDNRVAWRCGQGPVPDGAIAMDAQATPFTTDIMARYLPSACRPLIAH